MQAAPLAGGFRNAGVRLRRDRECGRTGRRRPASRAGAADLLAGPRVHLGGAKGCWSVQCSEDVAAGSQESITPTLSGTGYRERNTVLFPSPGLLFTRQNRSSGLSGPVPGATVRTVHWAALSLKVGASCTLYQIFA